MSSQDFKLGAAAIGLALIAGACRGAAAKSPGVGTEDERSAVEVRQVLVDSSTIARDYGRKHLGHYLDLTAAKLERAGLAIPSGIEVTVGATHVGYCIKTRSASLGPSHAWAVATTGSDTGGPSPDDRCPRGPRY